MLKTFPGSECSAPGGSCRARDLKTTFFHTKRTARACAEPKPRNGSASARLFGVCAFSDLRQSRTQAIPSTIARTNNRAIPFCQWMMMAGQLFCNRWATNGMVRQMGSSANNCQG